MIGMQRLHERNRWFLLHRAFGFIMYRLVRSILIGHGQSSPWSTYIMANKPTITESPVTESAEKPAVDKLAAVLAAFNAAPASQITAFGQMVVDVAKAQGLDYFTMTAGKKAAHTRRVKEAIKAAGISL
jgi:hypothetical protein